MKSTQQIVFLFLLFSLLFFSCQKNHKKVDVSGIVIETRLSRFDLEFYESNDEDLPYIKDRYPYLFPIGTPDSVWIRQKHDSLSRVLLSDVKKTFGDFAKEKKAIDELFKHVKYYYPKFRPPHIITLISHLDLENQVIFADSLLLISVDTYLGAHKKYYANYPEYLQHRFDKNYIPNKIASSVAQKIVPHLPYRLFIEKMISKAKTKYVQHLLLPDKKPEDIMEYPEKKYRWALDNEAMIWQYFIEKEYVYNTDKDLNERFLNTAPFSKFYMDFDNESPGQIGVWTGYRIIDSYMKNNEVSLPQMLATSPIMIFNNSKYKP